MSGVAVIVRGEAIRVDDVVTLAEEPHQAGMGFVAELRGPVLGSGVYDVERTWARVVWDRGGYDWLRALELGVVDVRQFERGVASMNAQRPD